MQRIAEDIKTGQLKQIYLLYGEEAYLIRQYRDKLKCALLGDGSDMNVNRFEGKGVPVPQIIDMAETLPFFADRRGHYSGIYGTFQIRRGKTFGISEKTGGEQQLYSGGKGSGQAERPL